MADFSKDFLVEYGKDAASCTIRFRCFDVPNSVTVYDIDEAEFDAEGVLLEVRRRCLDYHRLWSFSLPESDISRLNEPVERVEVDARTVELLEAMKAFNAVEPAFDFTIGPVSYLWKHAEQVPSPAELEAARAHVGASKVSFEGSTVIKADPETRVDVGGAAKGFVADDIAAYLRGQGVSSADIDLGGNLYMLGEHPSGRAWRVAVHVPEGIEAKPGVLEVRDRTIVTSGSYERFVKINGERYQHIVDASTGWPAKSDIVSATVVAESSLEADMLATTALIAGSAGLEALKRRHPDVQFVAITFDGVVL